ncbi:hypothetical protein PAMP_014018 [Pampus punctatissimus]
MHPPNISQIVMKTAARDAVLRSDNGGSQLCLQGESMAASEAVNRTKKTDNSTCEKPLRHHDTVFMMNLTLLSKQKAEAVKHNKHFHNAKGNKNDTWIIPEP